MALTLWTLYGMVHDPAKKLGFCDRCCRVYEAPPAEASACPNCQATVTVPT